ncbi:hypothetical protein SCHPADRAFT_833823 [Schizopora paradoxa]|uniref:F-box domain-containing protein n=1 Tax=Schizopora paradoxa TaxID=27342 RepID=A0A0H2RCS9_9AGAM|nr:hypothetical protein SCHPADRAFT_833823 [Schizopora paradoxa]
MLSIASLPSELLCMILEHATDNPLRHDKYQFISTFSTNGENAREQQLDDALKTKVALCRVSRAFKSVTDGFLYEDIRVRYGSEDLAARLEASLDANGHNHHPCHAIGCRVRRVCIYPAEDENLAQMWAGTLSRNACHVLRCCPHIEALARKNSAPLELPSPEFTELFTTDDLQLTSLRRVDWTNETYSALTDSPRMNLPLPHFIWNLPALEILSINGSSFPNLPPALSSLNVRTINLPVLHTIRLSSYNAIGMGMHYPRAQEVKFPALRRLIIGVQGAFYSAYEGCLSAHRSGVTILELGCDAGFLRLGTLRSLLRFYTNVEELRIPICTTAVDMQTFTVEEFPSVRRVLYSAAMPEADPDNEYLKENLWRQVKGHLEQFIGSNQKFVNVESITLVGEAWIPIVCGEGFKELADAIEKRGIKIVKKFFAQ